MKLLKIRLRQFRRFAEDQGLDLNEDLIALVGPNEAGKSSILEAIELLGKGQSPTRADVTRSESGRATVSGLYLLGADDKEAIKDIHDTDKVDRIWVDLRSDRDNRIWRFEDPPHRDLGPRQRCAALVKALEGDPALDAQYSRSTELPWDPQMYVDIVERLSSDDETLPDEVIQSFETLSARLRDLEYPGLDAEPAEEGGEGAAPTEHDPIDQERSSARTQAADALSALAHTERLATPGKQVIDALNDRLPLVAFFQREDRELQSDYNFNEIVDNPPPALANLCAIAGLNLAEVKTELAIPRLPRVEKLFEDANSQLRARFQGTWTQSGVYPRFAPPHEGILRIFLATEGNADYSEPRERSDGLRWFIALHAFLVAKGAVQPILLVDEAETHLHYDAQADLIDALMGQEVAAKVVYTTHSVGCLPPDLGRGIRAILVERAAERSHIANSYWSVDPGGDDRVGYTPLLFAMGARLLSLTVPRYAVIGEGPSDAILLPTLLREVADITSLPYRVVPGLADLEQNRFGTLSEHAGKVACLADGDDEGLRKIAEITDAGIDAKSLFHLGNVAAGCSLEDLVTAEVFAEAVNVELDTWSIGPTRVGAGVPSTGRWRWLEATAESEGTEIRRLSKTRVAQRMVDLSRLDDQGERRSLVSPELKKPLLKLHKQICALLRV